MDGWMDGWTDSAQYAPPLPFCWGRVEPPTKFSKRGGGLTGPQILEGIVGKEGRDLFQGVAFFSLKIN